MEQSKQRENSIVLLKKELIGLEDKIKDKEFQKKDKSSKLYSIFSLTTPSGKEIYNSFSNDELIEILRKKAANLNHSPAQKEVLWVVREYIKKRFDKWPYALAEAGLATSAGKGGKSLEKNKIERQRISELLTEVNEKALELGKIPHPKDLPEICDELKKFIGDWGQVIEAAAIDPITLTEKTVYKIDDLEKDYQEMLGKVMEKANILGRSPMHTEIENRIKYALINRCGSWRNVLHQIGLEPVIRVKPFAGIYIDHRKANNREHHTNVLYNCHYKVLNISADTKANLETVLEISRELGRAPTKKEIEKDIRKSLQEACGSWSNALFQIGLKQTIEGKPVSRSHLRASK